MVAMIDGSCSPTTSQALNAPKPAPVSSPTSIARPIGSPAWKMAAKTQADSAIVAAGDRSISPEMITMVRTSATSPYSM